MKVRQDKLLEGGSYRFKIHNKVVLPGENQDAFILIGPNKKKYLLNSSYYKRYNLLVGQTVRCRIDKINCSGQVFLEPEHPYYRIGGKYDFLVKKLSSEKNAFGETIHTAWVSGLHGQVWPCVIDDPSNIVPTYTHISCRVARIKKSELILSYSSLNKDRQTLEFGKSYQFLIVDEKKYNEEELFVIEDPTGKNHLIRKDFYSHFNFKTGENIQARMIDLRQDGSYKIEPDNPYYKIGETYPFKFLRLELSPSSLESRAGTIWLEDLFGQEIQVEALKWQSDLKSYHPEYIICRIIRFRKGKLQLENLEARP